MAIDTASSVHPGRQSRTRALIVPREHGAWGLLFVPLFTGIVVGAASAHRILPLGLFALAALALFWLRTPVESLLGTTPLTAQTSGERKIAFAVSGGLALLAASCLAGLLWGGRNSELLLFGSFAALAFLVQTFLMRSGRKLRMSAQLVGAIGLTCTAPAAYYLATASLDQQAWWLWAANWMFAFNQIHYVQLRIHSGRAATFDEKCQRGQWFFLGQMLLIMILICAAYLHLIPKLAVIAFLPALARGFFWFFSAPGPLQVRSLGWSEMKQGILFGVLLAVTSLMA